MKQSERTEESHYGEEAVPGGSAESATDSVMVALCRFIREHSDEPLSLATLSEQAHLSPAHLQRRFTAAIGVSPKQFHTACRLEQLKAELQKRHPVTEALYSAGFGAPSRVYEKVEQKLGMTPRQYRRAGESLAISYAITETALGKTLIAATDRGICALQFGDSGDQLLKELHGEFPQAKVSPMPESSSAEFSPWQQAIESLFAGKRAQLDLPLDIRGTAFQTLVWRYLQQIPPGETRSYAAVAAAIGKPTAARAVARACATNRIALLIPCHRVVRGTGELSGYRWGASRKARLIQSERRLTTETG